jgi:hypothetical protein
MIVAHHNARIDRLVLPPFQYITSDSKAKNIFNSLS